MNLLYITGGIGDTCAFTSAISKLDEPVSIISPWHKLFLNHPNVISLYETTDYRVILDYQKFYSQFNNIYFLDSAHNQNFIKNNIHLCKSANSQLQLESNVNENEYYFSQEEEKYMNTISNNFPNLVLIQYQSATHKPELKCYKNLNIITAQQITNFLVDNNFSVLEVSDKTTLQNTINGKIEHLLSYEHYFNYRDYLMATQCCKFFIGIDSALNHFSSNKFNKKKGLVFWGSTNIDRFGYEHNINLKTRAPDAMYFTKEDIEYGMNELLKNVN